MTIRCRLLFFASEHRCPRGEAMVQPIIIPAGQELKVTLS